MTYTRNTLPQWGTFLSYLHNGSSGNRSHLFIYEWYCLSHTNEADISEKNDIKD